ncbi:hypothetical protein CWI38_0184p0070 [Hamiltosporidium tvaerminnensis]|uniref:Uncharacterized protein n=1 Tax=Hamiltosporidium tvaerminnensis TaxID=1176355 RepID=A0A4Q9LZZ3_9MICR|nr:hypothetical protein CWI38_0184p0070 [Hamiltosporidium tvaerminnensis]
MPRRAGKELEICVIKTVGIHGELTLELKQAGNEEDSELTININEDSDLRRKDGGKKGRRKCIQV